MKYAIIAALALAATVTWSAFPSRSESESVDINDVRGNWDSFDWSVGASDTLAVSINFDNAGSAVDLREAVTITFRMTFWTGAAQSNAYTTTSLTVNNQSNVTFTIPAGSMPGGPQLYNAEIYAVSGTVSRTLAQGKVYVFDTVSD